MKYTIFKIVVALFLLQLSAPKIFAQKSNSKPNIIFILTDDQKADALGYAGNTIVKTPQMDELAKRGVYYKNAIATTPICAASRASILTGVQERNHRYTFQTGTIDQDLADQSYPIQLKKQGYHTAFFGKLGVNFNDENKLFDVIDSYDRNNSFKDYRGYFYKKIGKDTVHLTRYTGYQAINYINQSSKDQPFCMSLSFSAPHAHDSAEDQYFSQPQYNKLFENTVIPDPILSEDKYFKALPLAVQQGFSRLRWTWRFDTPEKYQKMVKAYYRMITEVDDEIGKIRQTLKAKGLDKNTVIIVMGDNGYMLGERQVADKWLMYDASVKVPLIVYDPRVKQHRDVEEMALNIDVPSTILDLAGASIPKHYQGESLLNTFGKKFTPLKRDTVLIEHLWEFDQIPPSEGIRTNEWKYLRYVNEPNHEELYNLKSDHKEATNLSKDLKKKATLDALRSACERYGKIKTGKLANAPTNLSIEYIRDPQYVHIVDKTPEFCWQVPASSNFQLGYQVLVSSSKVNSDNNVGDMWNTQQKRSSISCNITYDGKKLESNKTYYWKVRIWDDANRLSDYTASQSFKVGDAKLDITTPNYFQLEMNNAKSVKSMPNGSKLYDFSKHTFGTVYFKYNAPQDDSLIVHMGETLDEMGNIHANPGGTIRYARTSVPVKKGTHNYMVKLTPDKRNTLPIATTMPDSFPIIIPFRYAQIERLQSEIKLEDIQQSFHHVYWEDNASSFSSDNEVLNQIWDLCKYSIKATTFAGVYVDGDRERIPYEADAYLNQLSHYTTDDEYAIARQTIEYFMRKPTWPTEWQQHVALMMHADYMYTGNTELIEKYYEPLKYKALVALAGDHGLITSTKVTPEYMKKLGFTDPTTQLKDITDWPPAQKDTQWKLATAEGERDGFVFMPYNTLINSLYYRNLIIMAEFAKALNKYDEALDFEAKAASVKQAINQHMFDQKAGVYTDGIGTSHASLHANMFALSMDVVPQDKMQSVVDFIKSRGMACSVYGAQYLMEALYKAGEAKYALDLFTDKSDRSWYNMIRVGATITLEAWDMKYKPNADWNHAWGAVPANMIPRGLWGITPATPGATIVDIKPQLANLKQSSIDYPTLRGKISCTFARSGARKASYEVTIPGNTIGRFYLKSGTDEELLHNGMKVSPLLDYITLQPGKNTIDLIVNSF